MNWRLASRLSVVTLAILVVVIVSIFTANRQANGVTASTSSTTSTSSQLQGTDLGGSPAPNFQLKDQNGKQISLAQFKGKPVVLTFLYTHCPDVCPLTAEKLHASMVQLGSSAANVGVVAVSTDPVRDTEQAAQAFSKSHRMTDYWHYLIGSHQQLSPVWSSYRVYAQPVDAKKGTVMHSSAVFVIDKQGNERVFLGDDFTSNQLTADLKTLLQE